MSRPTVRLAIFKNIPIELTVRYTPPATQTSLTRIFINSSSTLHISSKSVLHSILLFISNVFFLNLRTEIDQRTQVSILTGPYHTFIKKSLSKYFSELICIYAIFAIVFHFIMVMETADDEVNKYSPNYNFLP